MAIVDMLADLRAEINDLRQLEHVIQSDDFRKAYDSQANVMELDYYVRLRDVEAIKRFLRNLRPLDDYSVKELRLMSARLKVADYHLLNK
jgi:hypothetical protein